MQPHNPLFNLHKLTQIEMLLVVVLPATHDEQSRPWPPVTFSLSFPHFGLFVMFCHLVFMPMLFTLSMCTHFTFIYTDRPRDAQVLQTVWNCGQRFHWVHTYRSVVSNSWFWSSTLPRNLVSAPWKMSFFRSPRLERVLNKGRGHMLDPNTAGDH